VVECGEFGRGDTMSEGTIKEQAEKIREKLKDGSIFGVPIDSSNNDALLVAAYYMGQRDSIKLKQHLTERAFLTELIS
jgi:hypothetical protein